MVPLSLRAVVTERVQLTSRAIATVAPDRVRLQSRQLRSLTPFFPDVVDALGTWFCDVVLDGVIWGRKGRVQHVTDGAPSPLRSGLLICGRLRRRTSRLALTVRSDRDFREFLSCAVDCEVAEVSDLGCLMFNGTSIISLWL